MEEREFDTSKTMTASLYRGSRSQQEKPGNAQGHNNIVGVVAKELLVLGEKNQRTGIAIASRGVSPVFPTRNSTSPKNNVNESQSDVPQTAKKTAVLAPLTHASFPQGCLHLLNSLPGNSQCVDCGASHPTWASISYGILICLQCSGKHRHFGVNHSKVRSVAMDSWDNPSHVLSLLEGGNEQWKTFLQRHKLDCNTRKINGLPPGQKGVYETKAALFYRENLQRHVRKVLSAGAYKGRHVWREKQGTKSKSRPSSPKRGVGVSDSQNTAYETSDASSCTSDPGKESSRNA
jgi:hypothetical protein